MSEIDTQDYPSLYPRRDRKKYGQFRSLPDIEFKPEVKEVIENILSGKADEGKAVDELKFK